MLALILSLLGVGGIAGAITYFVGPAAILAFLPKIKTFAVKHGHTLLILAAILALGVTFLIYGASREKTGAQKVELRVEKQHTETIREVRSDEQLAQQVSDKVGAATDAKLAEQQAATDQSLQEIHDAIATLPATVAADRGPVLERVRASSNSLVDRANRAAEYTGPADEPDADRAPQAGDQPGH